VLSRDSLELFARCVENHLPGVCHGSAGSGHGFGLKGKGDSAKWPALPDAWLAWHSPGTSC
jgi:hypothetical protein